MKNIPGILFSSRLMAILILVFAISIATATFIENDFGSHTARAVVYNSWWFNILLFLGIINLTGTIVVKKLYRREKLSIFTFHLAFLLILTGAAITRFFGFEGLMHIRSGESSSQIISSDSYLRITATADGHSASAEKKVYFSALSGNQKKLRLNISGRKLLLECVGMIPNAAQTISEDPGGEPLMELVVANTNGKETVILSSRQPAKIGGLVFSLNDTSNRDGVNILTDSPDIKIQSPVEFHVMNMISQVRDTLGPHHYHPLEIRSLYNFNGIMVVPVDYKPSGRIEVTPAQGDNKDEFPDALDLKLSADGHIISLRYFSKRNSPNAPVEVKLNGISAFVSFGARMIEIPFSLQLKEFILERYPGSKSPSWFESRVNLIDDKAGIREERRVFMNNVLKYKGYRFYQSSYDSDELGTIFSVNHDFWGTWITYLGYLMLVIGFIFSMFNRNSRFRKLSVQLTQGRENRKIKPVLVLLPLLVFIGSMCIHTEAQIILPDSVYINSQHAAKFGNLLIQDPGGRIKPINTLSSELLRKVSRKTQLLEQTGDQVLLGMLVYPEFWQDVPMIRVGHPEIQKILRIHEPYVAFSGVFDFESGQHPYLLDTYVNNAYQKIPAIRSKFDNEMIRLDERINLCYQVYNGQLLRIFPNRNDPAKTWYSPVNLSGVFTRDDSVFVNSILPLYLRSLTDASTSKNMTLSDDALQVIQDYQKKFGAAIIPAPFKTRLEIIYNRFNVFDRLGSLYGLIGFVLLIFQFISVFVPRINLKPLIRFSAILIMICIGVHLAGLIARWYISDHAPWSNGYESLIYIAFATVVAGLIFYRKSAITLPVTSLLAWIILHVAHLNWMDPEITNLVPVLKSYWLLIHVAIITASYGFLALGALLSFINLMLMIVQTRKNQKTTGGMIAELSIVIEMTLIIGLYMLTTGTFLGGVWANESWGRYWGWDPKETWALVSVLVYAFVAHMRMVPGLQGNFIFNFMGLIGFSTIIMTYFGVNYYLSGLHSYAKGDPLPVPEFVYYTVAIIGLVTILAWENQRRLKKSVIP